MSNLSEQPAVSIVEKLGGRNGTCCCPAHDDRKASLSVNVRNGKLLVKCHAGCSQEAVVKALKERGLWPGSAQQVRLNTSSTEATGLDDETAYEQYARFRVALAIMRNAEDGGGQLTKYFEGRGLSNVPGNAMLLSGSMTQYLAGKELWCGGPAIKLAHGGFPAMVMPVSGQKGLQGAHVTYLTKDLKSKLTAQTAQRQMFGAMKGGYVQLGTPNSKKPLLVAEGIETALAASEITGMPAIAALSTTNMPSVLLPDCSGIIIAADNDNAGLEAAEKAARIWSATGRNVRIAVPDLPGGSSKYDWNDALCDARNDDELDDLRDQILQAKRFKSPLAITMEDFLQMDFPVKPNLMSPWLQSASVNMIHAARGNGKTWFALSVAYAVATGKPLMDWPVDSPCKVLYVDGELPASRLRERLAALGPGTRDLIILTQEPFHAREQTMPDLADPTGREVMDRIIEQSGAGLIILDSISTLVRSGIENDAESWAPIQAWAMGHRWRGRSIIFLHHEGRNSKPRGTSKREDTLDTAIGLKLRQEGWDENTKATEYDLTFTKPRYMTPAQAKPRILQMTIEAGKLLWSSKSHAKDNRERVAELMEQGFKGVDIARELGITKGRVSQIQKEIGREQVRD